MTDITAGAAQTEAVAPFPPPTPEATAELEAIPPQAVDGLAPLIDEGAVASTEVPPGLDDTSSELPAADTRAAALEIEHPIGPVRQGVLDHLIDSDGPQTVAQIIAGLGNYRRGTVEVAVLRELRSGRIERVAPGTYILAKSKPVEPPKPLPSPDAARSDGMTDQQWLDLLERWAVDPVSWNIEELGPSLDQADNRIPSEVKVRFVDRLRKRQERRREAEAALARRAAADIELCNKLIAATGGNIVRGPGIDDVAPIRAAMELVPLDASCSRSDARPIENCIPRTSPQRPGVRSGCCGKLRKATAAP